MDGLEVNQGSYQNQSELISAGFRTILQIVSLLFGFITIPKEDLADAGIHVGKERREG